MFSKTLTVILSALMLITGILPSGAAALTDKSGIETGVLGKLKIEDIDLPAADVTPEKAAEAAKFFIKIINATPNGDGNERTYSYNTVVELSEPTSFYDIRGNVTAYHFTYTVKCDGENRGYIIISAHSDLPLVCEYSSGNSPYETNGEKTVLYVNSMIYFYKTEDMKYINRYGRACDEDYVISEFDYFVSYRKYLASSNLNYILETEEANAALLDAAAKAEAEPTFKQRIITFFNNIIDFFKRLLKYALFDVYFNPDEPDTIPDTLEDAVLSFAGQNGCYLTESHFIDKEHLVPRRQSYFCGDYEVGNGICGAASWMMLLAYYRDGLGYTKIPDDEQMFSDLIVIFDKITDKLSPIGELAQSICDIINEKTDFYLGTPENSYEIIYALDAGIAQYLYDLGYTELALNCIRNINFSIPVLTESTNALLLRDVRGEIAEWLYEQTDGNINIILTLRQSAKSVAERSLRRSEPVVIGNWLSATDSSYANHYFLGTGYCKLKYEYKYNGTVIYTAEKTLIEIFDTWDDSHTSYIDWDVLRATCLYDVNSLASLG